MRKKDARAEVKQREEGGRGRDGIHTRQVKSCSSDSPPSFIFTLGSQHWRSHGVIMNSVNTT